MVGWDVDFGFDGGAVGLRGQGRVYSAGHVDRACVIAITVVIVACLIATVVLRGGSTQ